METKHLRGLEVKLAASDDEPLTFSGYGAMFGNTDAYGDVIAPGAFAASLAAHKAAGTNPLMLLNHDAGSLPIGVWTTLSEDGTGLRIEGKLLDTQAGRDTYTALKAGAIDGLSIGYRPIEFQLRSAPDDPRRTLKAVDLLEVSVVTFPANLSARVSAVKSLDMTADHELALIEHGFTEVDAKAFLGSLEAKYSQAAALTAARNLLMKITKEKNGR